MISVHALFPRLPRAVALAAVAGLLVLGACGGGGSPAVPPPEVTPPQVQTVSLSMPASRILGNKPVTLTAALGHSADVSWALAGGSPGTLSAASGASVTYTPPPAAVAAITPVTITATSGGVSASARLALTPDPRQRTGLALLAGSLGGRGLIDGSGSAARFNKIAAMDTDSNGNLVLADGEDLGGAIPIPPSAIRQVGPAGNVVTLTRPGIQFGHADGDSSRAQIGAVQSLSLAPNGDIYMIDNDGTERLRVLRADGSIATVATVGGGVLVDRAGVVYVYNRARILRVAADGGSTVLAGGADSANQVDGQGEAARFWNISDAAADAAGNLYVADGALLRKVTPAGQVTTVATTDGAGGAVRFAELQSLAADASGNLQLLEALADASGYTGYAVRQVTPAGVASTLYQGAAPPFTGLNTAKDTATRVARLRVNRLAGRTLLAHTAQVDQLAAGKLDILAGLEGDSHQEVDGPGAAARFVRLSHLAADLAGNVYTLDFAAPFGGARNEEPHGLWLRKIAPDGATTTVVADAAFPMKPTAVFADADGNLFVSAKWPWNSLTSPKGGALYKVTPDGKVSLFAGSTVPANAGTATSTDGTGAAATFFAPTLEGIDVNGNLFVSDNDKIRRITPQAVVSTVAALPAGLKAAPDGKVYSADAVQNVIYATDAAGNKSVVAGVPGALGTRLTALPAGLERPAAIVPTGPNSFALISGAAVLRLLLPN